MIQFYNGQRVLALAQSRQRTGRFFVICAAWVGPVGTQIGLQHVIDDLGFIFSFADWGRLIAPQGWMLKGRRLDQLLDDAPPELLAATPLSIAA
jgi:hypothetical protein